MLHTGHLRSIDAEKFNHTALYFCPFHKVERPLTRTEKRYTGRMMTHTDPMRGPNWVERMLADRRDDLVRALKAYIKRLGG